MPVTVDYENEARTIVRYVFAGRWTWAEFYPCWDWMKQQLDASDHPIAVMMDLSASGYIPLDTLTHVRALAQQVHPNFAGVMALVGVTSMGALYKNLASKLAPDLAARYTILFVSTLEEARRVLDDWLAEHDELPPRV